MNIVIYYHTLHIACECEELLCVSAMRDLFASMERAGGSFPPIMMLNVLHMVFPQFAQKNDQGVFQQQVVALPPLLLLLLLLILLLLLLQPQPPPPPLPPLLLLLLLLRNHHYYYLIYKV